MRSQYYSYIRTRLVELATQINIDNKLNISNLNIHCEVFYKDLLNKIEKWQLTSTTNPKSNYEAIDLIDKKNKFIVQVSSTSTKEKIESSLSSDVIKKHQGYTFKFISISKDATKLKNKIFKNPHNIKFNPQNDIIDINSINRDVYDLEINLLADLCEFIKKEVTIIEDVFKLDSDLVRVVKILAKDDLVSTEKPTINSFEIDRKIEFNKLKNSKEIIADFFAYSNKVDGIYKEFDSQGSNISLAVLEKLRDFYRKNKQTKSDDELFSTILKETTEFVKNNQTDSQMSQEQMELCVKILIVDAFVRCKIFENPNNYNYQKC